MADLIYSISTSLDGFIEDAAGSIDFTAPDAELHGYFNDQERGVGTYLFGRRMYETMRVWDTPEELGDEPELLDYAAVWAGIDKVVFSTTLPRTETARTRLERTFDPRAVAAMKAEARSELGIGGADLAGQAIRAGLVDEIRLFVRPIILGGGKPALPADVRVDLELLEERRFAGGTVMLRYRAAPDSV